jgi:nucleoside-diphosphate-sugar epimerase
VKRILIAGQNSYIGVHLDMWLDPSRCQIDTLDMRGDDWRVYDFSGYDSVVLVAGIAHRRETDANRTLFDQVNHRLAADAGKKSKREGVKQFVFFSSMSVYGMEVGRIHAETLENPNTAYGNSKLAAEKALMALSDDAFRVAILRPPMIYGPGCKGNYPRLSRLIRKLHVFPRVKNERSMLYINTLCAFMDALLESGAGGLFFPQNRNYVTTDDLALAIAKAHRMVLFRPHGFGWLLKLMGRNGGTVGKVFGTLTYDQSMSTKLMPKKQTEFFQSIVETEASV